MSSSATAYLPKLNDRDVIRAFEKVFATIPEEGAPRLTFSDSFGQLQSEEIAEYGRLHGYSLRSVNLQAFTCTWVWSRLFAEHNGDPNRATHDLLAFHWNQQNSPQQKRQAIARVSSSLESTLLRPLNAVGDEIPGKSYSATEKEILLALEGAAAQVLTDATNHRHALELAFAEKDEALTKRVEEQRQRELDRLTEEKARVDAELANRRSALDERQQSLDELQKKLDDRNNTHVRREIRSSLLELTKDRLANFGVSSETKVQYLLVHAVSLCGLAFLIGSSLWYGSRAAATGMVEPTMVEFAVKASILAAAAIALGAWYLRWLNRWLQRIADAEFRLQQFRLDIERASWLAETVLEWKTTSPEPFPELLASRLSAGLFHSSTSEVDDPKTPASHLAEALFGAATSARIKLGNQEVMFDRKGIQRLEQEG